MHECMHWQARVVRTQHTRMVHTSHAPCHLEYVLKVHNDGERHVPYLMLWPDGLPSKMRAWASGQLPDGMIQEQLACGCMDAVPTRLDVPCGRVMGDVSSMFVLYAYELWRWTADVALVVELWPVAKRAAQWQLDRAAAGGGLPRFMVDTYDGAPFGA